MRNMRRGFKVSLAAAAFVCALSLIQILTGQPFETADDSPAEKKTAVAVYVGSEKCLMCHGDKEEAWSANAHKATETAAADELKGCEACHGPGSLHADVGGAKAHIVQPWSKNKVESSAICLKCHGDKESTAPKEWRKMGAAAWRKTKHYRKDILCGKCHKIHDGKPSLLTQEPKELCKSCHADIQKGGYVHTPVKQGMCGECHSPHGAELPHMVKKGVAGVCVGCHAVDKPGMSEKHGGFNITAANCVECHNPHAKESGGKLLRKAQHVPFKSRNCGICHGEKKEGNSPAISGAGEVCAKCHSGVIEEAAAQAHQHYPVTEKLCANCHSPHVSDKSKMMRDDMDILCSTCHKNVEDQLVGMYEHPPVSAGQCTSCHKPHGSGVERILKEEPDQLCKSCHENIKFSHPMVEQDKNPDFEPIIRCYSCHSVHGSDIAKLLPWSGTELCNKCHRKDVVTPVQPEEEE